MHAVAELAGQVRRNMVGNIHAHLIDQTQRPHRHAELQHGLVDVLHARAVLEQMSRFDEIRHENAVHEEAGRVPHHDGQLANLLDELNRAPDDIGRSLPADDHLDQLHPMDGIEEVDADDTLGMLRCRGDFADGKRGGVARQNRVRSGQFIKPRKQLLLEIHPLDRRLDDHVRAVQRHIHR